MGFTQWRIINNDNSSHVAVCVAKWQQPTIQSQLFICTSVAHVHSTYNVLQARTSYMSCISYKGRMTTVLNWYRISTIRSISRINGTKFVFAVLQLVSFPFYFHVAQRLLQFAILIEKHISSMQCGCWTTDIDEIYLLFSINRCKKCDEKAIHEIATD